MKQVILTFVSLMLATGVALAHSDFLRSEPAENATLKQPPNEIKIWFSEPIKTALSTIEVHDAAGKKVDLNNLHADAKAPALVRLSLPPHLAPGTYKVTWSAVAQDLHVGKGSFSFRVAP